MTQRNAAAVLTLRMETGEQMETICRTPSPMMVCHHAP
jgi:hypothetical protein